ncbi:MAG TPA: hypothetical protein VKY92_14070, partial [Verrucomicrobiae bacterium]|nr:hypothetical protein [Verrucomicrobiae bacterium]
MNRLVIQLLRGRVFFGFGLLLAIPVFGQESAPASGPGSTTPNALSLQPPAPKSPVELFRNV